MADRQHDRDELEEFQNHHDGLCHIRRSRQVLGGSGPQLIQGIVTAILVDFPLKYAIFRFEPACRNGRRPRSGSIAGTEIAKRVMTKVFPDVTIAGADHRRSALMAAAQVGDSTAYQTLLRDCIPVIKSVARRRGVHADLIDDVVQDVLLTIHRARHTYDPGRSFTAWLCVIAERRAIDLLRRTRRQDKREIHAPIAFESRADEAADPSRGLAHADATGTVTRALAGLRRAGHNLRTGSSHTISLRAYSVQAWPHPTSAPETKADRTPNSLSRT